MIEHPFAQDPARTSVNEFDFRIRQSANKMQMVGHQAITEQAPIVFILGPQQGFDHFLCQRIIAKQLALVARTNGEEIFVFGGGVNFRR